MELMVKSEMHTISGTITSYSFDAPKALRLPTMSWDPTVRTGRGWGQGRDPSGAGPVRGRTRQE
jgi:hypothetical protein